MAGVVELELRDIDSRLDNVEIRSRCNSPVCEGMKIPSTCSDKLLAENTRCLVNYHYPMTFEETVQVAEEADYSRKISEAEAATQAAAEEEAQKVPLAPFRPDWRFWTGVTLSGLGLFFYRNR